MFEMVSGFGFLVQGSRFRVQGSWIVSGFKFRVSGECNSEGFPYLLTDIMNSPPASLWCQHELTPSLPPEAGQALSATQRGVTPEDVLLFSEYYSR